MHKSCAIMFHKLPVYRIYNLYLFIMILLYRKRLFSMMNDLPTVFEVVTERKPVKDKPSMESGSKSQGSTKVNHLKNFLSGLISAKFGLIEACIKQGV